MRADRIPHALQIHLEANSRFHIPIWRSLVSFFHYYFPVEYIGSFIALKSNPYSLLKIATIQMSKTMKIKVTQNQK